MKISAPSPFRGGHLGCAAVIAALCLAALAPARADWPKPQAAYSASGMMETGGLRIPYKVYHDRGKERREMTMEGMEQVVIALPDEGKMYMLMPAMNMAMEMAMKGNPSAAANEMEAYNPEPLGKETVNGIETTKYRIEADNTGAGAMTGFAWATEDGILVRMEATTAEGRVVFSLDELVRAPQDPALFRLPAGVQVMPAGAMQQ